MTDPAALAALRADFTRLASELEAARGRLFTELDAHSLEHRKARHAAAIAAHGAVELAGNARAFLAEMEARPDRED